MKGRIKNIKHKRQIKQMAVISILFCVGIGIGTAFALGTADVHRNLWITVQEENISNLNQVQWQYYMAYLIWEKGKWYGMLLLFSVTIFALPYIAVTILYKGICIGFFFVSLQMVFGWKGIVFAFAVFFPQSLLFFPVTVVYLLFLLQLHRDVREYRNVLEWKLYLRYAGFMILCIVFGCLLQAKVNLLIVQSAAVLLK